MRRTRFRARTATVDPRSGFTLPELMIEIDAIALAG